MGISKNLKTRLVTLVTLAAVGSMLATASLTTLVHAAPPVDNWLGTDCNAAVTPDCSWSNINNWDNGVPINGMNLVFDQNNMQGLLPTSFPTNDMTGLSVATITMRSDKTNLATPLEIQGNSITVTGNSNIVIDVTADVPAYIYLNNITLGADSIVSNTSAALLIGLPIGKGGGSTLTLNGHSLNFNVTNDVHIDSVIQGVGFVTYNGSGVTFTIAATNTYSGSTKINGGTTVTGGISTFGTSVVEIAGGGHVIFDKLVDGAIIANAINVENGVSTSASLTFGASSSGTVAAHNITLLGTTRFNNTGVNGSGSGLTVDINGIVANGNCLVYASNDSVVTNGSPTWYFINGPGSANCSTKSVTAPNTAIQQFVFANPIIIAGLGILTAGIIVFASRRQLSKK